MERHMMGPLNRRFVLLAVACITAGFLYIAPDSFAAQQKSRIFKMDEAAQYKPQIGKYGGMLRLTTISDPKTFNPIVAKETSSTEITGNIFEGLTRENGISGEVEPNLAERWTVSEDGLTYTFFLRKDVTWSDGVPFTAHDVVFTYRDVVANEEVPTSARDILTVNDKYPEVSAVDEHTVQFKTGGKFAPFLRTMGMEIIPKHKLEPFLKQGPREFSQAWGVGTPPEEIVGTGPFMLEKYEASQRVLLKRNPNYWRKDAAGNRLPYIQNVLYMVVKDIGVALLRFKEGQADIFGLRGEDYQVLDKGQGPDSYFIYQLGPTYGSEFLVFNQNTGTNSKTGKAYVDPVKLSWFTNDDFRRAVMYALDRQSMVDIAMNGFGIVQDGPESPKTGFFYNSKVPKYPYNPKKAKELLATQGFKYAADGKQLLDAKGRAVEFAIITNSGSNNVRGKIAEMIIRDLSNVGIKANLVPMEFNIVVDKIDVTYDWEAIVIGLTGGPEPHFGANVWRSPGIMHMWYPKEPKPATPWEARLDAIFDQGVQELDANKRKKLYDEFQVIVAEKAPFMYTVIPETLVAVRTRFGNLAPSYYEGVRHNLDELFIAE
jgi:peptide/nickel transport system substrate-binding protein